MSESGPVNPQLVRDLLMAFVVSRSLHVAAELGVADALAAGPKDQEALAQAVGAHADTLRRVLRALEGAGVFEQLPDGRFANTARSECLRSDVPGSLRALARMHGGLAQWQAWAGLEHSVRTGEPSFAHVHGLPMFDYLAANPEAARRFDEAMANSSRLINAALVEAYAWSGIGTLVDVAGGVGSTLAAIMRANPRMQGVLFDLPHVVERGRAYLAEEGLAERCRTEEGSFFATIPSGGDAYFMKHILHDWNDDDCLRILSHCKAAMADHAKLLVCEKIVPPGNEPSVAKTMDLVMLVLTHGGRERTEKEFRDLFARAGLRLTRVVSTRADNVILEVTR